MSNYRRIVLRHEVRVLETGKFSVATSPGMILEYAAGDVSQYRPHPTEGGDVKPLRVAEINYLLGEGVSDSYAIGDKGPVAFLRPGDVFVGILEAGVDYSQGDRLMSAGGGLLKKITSEDNDESVGILKEDVDLSDTDAENTHAKVEVA